MKMEKVLEQQIAVFGESGSGKTVLLSSFYGRAQEPTFQKENPFDVIAYDTGQGNALHRNFLGMRDSSRLPDANRFGSTSYSFKVKLKEDNGGKPKKEAPIGDLRIIWHDYPGEWFEQDVSGPEEAQRRVDTFRSLLQSDVALILVDGQRLVDNRGEEERYLKALFNGFRNSLLGLKAEILDNGKPIAEFPRIWVLALSKADLLPELDVFGFRDLIIGKTCDELDELRKVIAGIVDGSEALSIGEDFVLLSSAKFEPGKIEVDEQIGVDLLLPLTSILPFERHVHWADSKQLPAKVAENLLRGAGVVAAALAGKRKKLGVAIPGKLGFFMNLLDEDLINDAANLAGVKLRELNESAKLKSDRLGETLTQFKLDLIEGEKKNILLRSRK